MTKVAVPKVGPKPKKLFHPSVLIEEAAPAYTTESGAAYFGNSLLLMQGIRSKSVNLVITSPPYALQFQKEYGNVSKKDYVAWFLPFGREIKRILAEDGSFVLNIGGSY